MIAKTDGILNRREFLKGALGTGAALALSGCGWRAASGHTTLTYNTFWTGRDAHTSAMNWLYRRFRELHPDVDLEVVQVAGGAADNGRKQMAELAAGGGPDILHDTTYDQIRAGYVLELTEHIEPWRERFHPEALAACTWDGHVFSLPTEYSVVPSIWHTGLLESVGRDIPQTFEELMDLGAALKRKGANLTCSMACFHHVFFAILFGDPNIREVIARKEWESEAFLRAVKPLKQIVDAGFLPENDMEIQRGNASSLFQNGQIAVYMAGAYILRNLITAEGVDPELRNRVAFTPFPEYQGARPIRGYVPTKTALNQQLTKDKAKLKAALKFLELFTSKESAIRFVTDAQSPLGVKVKVTEEMTGPLFYKFLMSEKQATSTFVLPNNPGAFDALATTQALTDMFASLDEGASAKKALSVFAEVMRS